MISRRTLFRNALLVLPAFRTFFGLKGNSGSLLLGRTGDSSSTVMHHQDLRRKYLLPYAVFRELQLGSVRPEGWLRKELIKEASGFTGHQPEFCFPFDRHYWAGNERGQDEESRHGGIFWYPWEQMGYWADGAYRCARLISDERLKERALEPIRYTVGHPVDGWFLGPRRLLALPPNPTDEDPGRWPQAVFFRALAGAAEGENMADIITAMRHHYLNDTKCDYQHGPYGPRDRVNIESLLWCYGHSGDQQLLDMAKRIWSAIPAADLHQLTEDQPSQMHGVTFAEVSKLAALLYMYTGDKTQRDISVAAMRRIFKYHMLCDGTPSTTEELRGTTALDGHETCDIVEFNISWSYMVMATGTGSYADHIERALFNAGMGAIRKGWSGFQYISCPNQLHIARNSCQPTHVGTAAALYGPNSDHRPEYPFITACCAGNVSRMLPTYVQRMWMSAPDEGLATVLYGPSRVTAVVGKKQQEVEIIEETSYPFSEKLTFHFRTKSAAEFPLHLRIPGWCDNPKLQINGKSNAIRHFENGFYVLNRTYHNGDMIELELPMNIKIGHSSDGGIFLERGPLVYSLQPDETWTAIPMADFEITSPEFPMWAATAGSPWNVALALDESIPINQQITLKQNQKSDDPWSQPHLVMSVLAKRIPGWDLIRPKGNDANWFRTPPLPPNDAPLSSQQTITLVPYGSTHLRLTVFPNSKIESTET